MACPFNTLLCGVQVAACRVLLVEAVPLIPNLDGVSL
jgi:hypothetical protein